MQRLLCVLMMMAAACSDDGTGTGAATLSGTMPTIKSAYAKSFKGTDGSGAMVLGWKIELTDSAVGTGCKVDSLKVQASVGIFTSQVADSSHSVADLQTGDISIVVAAPPTAPMNSAAANMGATGVAGIEGTISITGVGKAADGKTVLRIDGMVNAGGSDGNGNPVVMSGMFDAPNCN